MPTVHAFGKAPCYGDFLRHRSGPLEQAGIVAFFEIGLDQNMRERGNWSQVTESMRPMRFLHSLANRDTLVGIVVPSRDRVGRTYPLIVAMTVPEAAGLGATLRQYDGCFAALEDAAQAGQRDADLDGFRASLDAAGEAVVSSTALDRSAPPPGLSAGEFSRWISPEGDTCQWVANLDVAFTEGVTPRFVVLSRYSSEHGPGLVADAIHTISGSRRPNLMIWDAGTRPEAEAPLLRLLYDRCEPRYFAPCAFPTEPHDLGWNVTPGPDPVIEVSEGWKRRLAPALTPGATFADLMKALRAGPDCRGET